MLCGRVVGGEWMEMSGWSRALFVLVRGQMAGRL
jgi:hypothetical protein